MENTVVKIENLVKNYAELRALDHFNLEIRQGEIFGLLGPNGSGKTTTISCLLSLLSFDEGTIEVFGKTMTPTSYDLKSRIGIIPQNVAVFNELNVYENVDCFCSLYIPDKAKRKQYVDEAIAFVGLEDFVKFRPKKLSGGLLRRLNIACGIAHKPDLIILDEPTVAVDPQSRNKILEGIVETVLSGGRYDRLMHKLGRKSGAIGFAVYLDLLSSLHTPDPGPDVDVLLLAEPGADPERVARAAERFTGAGRTVSVQGRIPAALRYGECVRLEEAEKC